MAEENFEKNTSIEVLPVVIEPEKKQAGGSDAGIIKEEILDLSGEKIFTPTGKDILEKGEIDPSNNDDKEFIRNSKKQVNPAEDVPARPTEQEFNEKLKNAKERSGAKPETTVDEKFQRVGDKARVSEVEAIGQGDSLDEKLERVRQRTNSEPERTVDEKFQKIRDQAEANLSIEEVADDKPKKTSLGQRFLSILKTGGELGKNLLENSRLIAGELIEKAKPKVEIAINKARDIAEEAGHIAGGLAIKGGGVLKEKAGDVANFLKESGIALKAEIGSNLESAISLAADTFEKISNSDVVQGAVDRISIFRSSMAEAWVGSRVDQFNEFIKQEEVKVQVVKNSLESREADLANLRQISKDVGFEVSDSAKKKLEEDIAKKSAELKSENDRIDTIKAENSFYDIKRTGYLAKIEGSKRNIADRIQAKIDINSEHSQELQTSLDELSSNKKRVGGELEKLTTHFRELDRMTRETNSSGARRSAVNLMRQIGPKINGLEEELIACNKDEGKILKRKAKIDAKLEKNDEQLGDLGVSPREKKRVDKVSGLEALDLGNESIVPTPIGNLEKEEKPVYFEDSLDNNGGEILTSKQEKKETETKFSLDEFLTIWNKDFPELSLVRGSFSSTSKTRRDKSNMSHVVLNLINNQHPGSNIKVVKLCIDAIYKK